MTPAKTSRPTATMKARPMARQERTVTTQRLSTLRSEEAEGCPPGPRTTNPGLTSAKALKAMLLLAGVVVAAAGVFLWVVFSKACG